MKMNNKGFSLIEVVLVLAITAIIAPMFYGIFNFGLSSYTTGNNYLIQQDIVTDSINILSSDIERAASYRLWNTDTDKYELTLWDRNIDTYNLVNERTWILGDNSLSFDNGSGILNTVIKDIDTTNSKISLFDSSIQIEIKPINKNDVINKNRNVLKPVITEVLVLYKEKVN